MGKLAILRKNDYIFLYFSIFSDGKNMNNRKITESKLFESFQKGSFLLRPFIIEQIERGVRIYPSYVADAVIDAKLPESGELLKFVVEAKTSNTPLIVQRAIVQVKEASENSSYNPMIIVPYLSPERLSELEKEKVSGVDLCGNGVLIVPDRIYVFRSGQPNRYRESRPLNNPYKGRSAMVARMFLMQSEFSSLNALQKMLGIAGEKMVISQVSKAVQALENDLIVSKSGGMISLLNPSLLLDRLSAEWKRPVFRSQQNLRLPAGLNSLSSLSQDPLLKWAVTGESSVLQYAVFAQGKPLKIAVTDIAAAFKLIEGIPEPVANFADVVLFETDEPGFFFSNSLDASGIRWAGRLQTFLELSAGDARQKEAAADIRKQILKGVNI